MGIDIISPEKSSSLKIKIRDENGVTEGNAAPGEILLDILRRHGKGIDSPCGGRGTCGKCRVEIENIGIQLACRYRVDQNLTITIPRKNDATILENSIIADITEDETDAGIIYSIDPSGEGTCMYRGTTLWHDKRPKTTTVFGIAIDIGTTTVVAYLENLITYELIDTVSFLNPQADYGGDVVSRIHYTMEQKDGLTTLQTRIVTAINDAIRKLCARNEIDADRIGKITIAGNTIMLHLLLGVDPSSIAQAPFTPNFTEKQDVDAASVGIKINPKGRILVLPSLAGYVGADIIAGIASTPIMKKDDFSLFIDIGTNGEMAIGNDSTVLCCATAAGPAFEGATIECGVGGVEGAISWYKKGQYKTIGDRKPVGICGSGLIDIVAYLLESGRLDPTGFMDGDYVVVPAEKSGTGGPIVLTPKDVREVQLAKAAISAGISILMKEASVECKNIARVYLAGAFGNFIDTKSAMTIGLLPEELDGKIIPIGNSAGMGARLALRSVRFDDGLSDIANKCEYIELSMRMDFNEEYMNAMGFGISM